MKSPLVLLYFLSWIGWFASQMLGPIYAIFVEDIGGDILDAGISWAIFAISMGLLTIMFGYFEDRKINKRTALVFGCLLITLGTAGYLFVQTPWHLFVTQAILGIGAAIAYPAWDALFMRTVKRGREGTEWAAQEGGIQIVGGVAAIVGSYVAMVYGFKTLFVIMLAIQMIGLLLSLNIFLPMSPKKYN